MLMHQWKPPSPIPTSPTNDSVHPSKHRMCLRWSKLLVSATIPLILIGCFFVYFVQRETFFDEHRQQQEQHRREDHYQASFDAYVKEISDVLLRASDERLWNDIRGKTLTILRDLDDKRKGHLILFLYERHLLRTNQLDLHGADLRNVPLSCPTDFHHLHLPGVIWSNGRFSNCRFISAVFDRASLDRTQFINCTLQDTSLLESNLAHSSFQRTFIVNSTFHRASLIEADFLQMNIVQGSNFSAADLFQAKFTEEQLHGKGIDMVKHDFHQARFPNGSFDMVDTTNNLLLNADAESECPAETPTHWKATDSNRTFVAQINPTGPPDWGNCSFALSSVLRVYQTVDLYPYSLLIDTKNAAVSFSAFASCEQSFVEMTLFQSNGLLQEFNSYSKSNEAIAFHSNLSMFLYGTDYHRVPMGIRSVRIDLGVKILPSGTVCYFDNLTLTVHQRRKK